MTPVSPGVALTAGVCSATIALCMVAAVARLWAGPTLADRVIALELLGFLLIGLLGAETLRTGHVALVDAALAFSLMIFISTLVFARFVECAGGDPP